MNVHEELELDQMIAEAREDYLAWERYAFNKCADQKIVGKMRSRALRRYVALIARRDCGGWDVL